MYSGVVGNRTHDRQSSRVCFRQTILRHEKLPHWIFVSLLHFPKVPKNYDNRHKFRPGPGLRDRPLSPGKGDTPLHSVRFSETNLPYRIFSHKRDICDAHISHKPNEWRVEHATFVHVLLEHWRFTWLGQFWSPLLVPDKFSISSRIRFPSYRWSKSYVRTASIRRFQEEGNFWGDLNQFLVWIFRISIDTTFSAWQESVVYQ